MTESYKRYLLITFNDGSIPVAMTFDTVEEARDKINQFGYIQHWLIRDTETDELIDISDMPEEHPPDLGIHVQDGVKAEIKRGE